AIITVVFALIMFAIDGFGAAFFAVVGFFIFIDIILFLIVFFHTANAKVYNKRFYTLFLKNLEVYIDIVKKNRQEKQSKVDPRYDYEAYFKQ
ncbi:hypothetical protein LJB88_04400, partial [Erysipelotrichaceae bacterium OttesenSCG-928-M19]|nr:hypothetical protein [Erysipelotrichaceae bacterium OttesenSCG-928-M19]